MSQVSFNAAIGSLGPSGGALSTRIRLAGRAANGAAGSGVLLGGGGGSSPDNTIVTPGGGISWIIDNALNRWAISPGGQITVNGLVDSTTRNVIELAWVKGVIWQLNTAGNWYSKTSVSANWSPGTKISPLPKSGVMTGFGQHQGSAVGVLTTAIVLHGRAFSDSFSIAFD